MQRRCAIDVVVTRWFGGARSASTRFSIISTTNIKFAARSSLAARRLLKRRSIVDSRDFPTSQPTRRWRRPRCSASTSCALRSNKSVPPLLRSSLRRHAERSGRLQATLHRSTDAGASRRARRGADAAPAHARAARHVVVAMVAARVAGAPQRSARQPAHSCAFASVRRRSRSWSRHQRRALRRCGAVLSSRLESRTL